MDGNKTYIPEYTNNSVCVIAANKTSTTCEKYISLGIGSKRPLYVAVDGNSDTIYVANFLNNSVSLINGTNQIYEKDIRVGKHPRFIYVDDSGKSSTIYVADSGENKVSLINGTTYQLEKNITVGEGPRYITASLDGTIYVANQYSNSVSVINGTTNHFEKNIPVGKEPVNIAVDDLTDTIYVANYGSNGISVIDGQSNNSTAGIIFHISPFNSGQVMCYIPKKTATPVNLHLYLWSGTKCIAEPNEGFQFSSWVET